MKQQPLTKQRQETLEVAVNRGWELLKKSAKTIKTTLQRFSYGLMLSYALGATVPITSSCAGSSFDSPEGCDAVECGEHASCALSERDEPLCICEEGYIWSGEICLADDHKIQQMYPDGGSGENKGNSEQECSGLCLDERTLQSCPPAGKEFFVQECPEGMYCREGACRTAPGGNDSSCSTGASACGVTDVFDVFNNYEDRAHDFRTTAYRESNTCGEDDGAIIYPSDSYWMAHTLQILPPPEGNGYYRLDFKMNWEGECQSGPPCCREYASDFTPSMKVLFGDDQRVDYIPTEGTRECIFEKIADFTTAGILGSSVRINVEGNPTKACAGAGQYVSADSGIVIAKTRIWSCECE